MNSDQFRTSAHELVDWMADYMDHLETYPVKSPLQPGDILGQLPLTPPQQGEPFEQIFEDFQTQIMPGITHWQHPRFFAYFPANTSPPSILAEMLTATLGTQCMVWETSPAAAELEERVMTWLREMCGLPSDWDGVIQDTASTATLCALLSAREQKSQFVVNQEGFYALEKPFTLYCSSEAHSSVEKAVKMAGLGQQYLRKIPVDETFALRPDLLEKAIQQDLTEGYQPLCVVAAIGTTGSTAIDPLATIGALCKQFSLWLHVDAAYAGSALILPDMRWMIAGIDLADSVVFNPHKWLFTNFDCSAYFVKDRETLIKTFEVLPEYLKTAHDRQVNNYRDWGIQLGRRFRALKLWFVIRSYGVEGLQAKISAHLDLARYFADALLKIPGFEILAPIPLNLVCFRYSPDASLGVESINDLNRRLLDRLNQSGKVYLTHTQLAGCFTLRAVFGQTNVSKSHVTDLLQAIQVELPLLQTPDIA